VDDVLTAELEQVLCFYALGEVRNLRRAEGGFVDDNWIVESGSGRYFLKRRHPRRHQSEHLIRAQHELMAWLRQQGFPAPCIVPTIRGDTFLQLAGQVYEVTRYIEGVTYKRDRSDHLDAAARVLGRYHQCVKGFAPEAFLERDVLYDPVGAHWALDQLCRAWEVDQDPALAQVARRLRARVDDLAVRFARHGELCHLVIHGDYHGGNLLYCGDQIVGVVDYDKANWQPRVAEVAEALIYFAAPRTDQMVHLVYPGLLNRERFARFLRNYATAVDLEPDEAQVVPDYVGCIWLTMSLRRLWEREQNRPAGAVQALHEALALGTWASINAPQMAQIAGTARAEHRVGERT
jgi:Ser/Thr protein kinase RdoA (MazF antagonist)